MANLSNINNYFVVNTSGLVAVGDASSSVLPSLTVPFTVFKSGANSILSIQSGGGSGKPYFLRSETDGSFSIYDDTACLERLTIASGGDVTIPKTLNVGTHSAYAIKLQRSDGTYQPFAATSGNHLYFYNNDAAGNYLFRNAADSSTLVTITNAGNVGIGTTSPATLISNSSLRNAAASGLSTSLKGLNIEVPAGANSQGYVASFANSQTASSNYNAGVLIEVGSTDTTTRLLSVESGGLTRFEVRGDGHVGIGTNTPENALHIQTSTTNTSSQLMVQNGSSGDAAIKFNISGQSYVIGIDNSDSDKFKIAGSSDLGISDRLIIDSSGNVAINYNNSNIYTYGGGAYSGKLIVKADSTSDVALTCINRNTSGSTGGNEAVSIAFVNEFVANQYNWLGKITMAPTDSWTGTASTRDADMLFSTNYDGIQSEKLRIKGNGNVGIGTNSPAGKLDVEGTIRATQITNPTSGTGAELLYNPSANTGYVLAYDRTNSAYKNFRVVGSEVQIEAAGNEIGKFNIGFSTLTNSDSGTYLYTNPGNRLLTSNASGWFADGRDPILTLSSSGNSNNTSIGNSIGLNLHNNSNVNGTFGPLITFSSLSESTSYNSAFAAIGGVKRGRGPDTNWTTGDLCFWVTGPIAQNPASYMQSTPSMVIATGGNVGIGLTNPQFGLSMAQGTGDGSRIGWNDGGSSKRASIICSSSTDALQFHTGTSDTERMRILASGVGAVMIRRTSSIGDYFLQVGDASLDNGYPIYCTVASTSGRTQINFSNFNNNSVGSISTAGSATSFNTSSDYRLKEDLKEFNGLDIVSQIKTYDFKWKDNDNYEDCDKRGYGVIAHEIETILPQIVKGEKDAVNKDGSINPQGVDYAKIVPLLVKSIQELKTEIETLKTQINN